MEQESGYREMWQIKTSDSGQFEDRETEGRITLRWFMGDRIL
jgi:hypothetical protein